MLNTSAITAVTKSSMMALPQIVTYAVVEKGMENKEEEQR